jgi:hypothetical protein
MKVAERLGLTRKNYVWVVAQAVISSTLEAPDEFPVGMLGVHFSTGNYKCTSPKSHKLQPLECSSRALF